MKKLSALLFFSALALVGCKDNDPVQTVDWYKKNPPERLAMIEKCRGNPGELTASPNCLNAQQADNETANARRGWLKPGAVDFGRKGE